jgi:hypothetical protein
MRSAAATAAALGTLERQGRLRMLALERLHLLCMLKL